MCVLTAFGRDFLLDDLVEEEEDDDDDAEESDRRYSCIIQLVLMPPLGASPI